MIEAILINKKLIDTISGVVYYEWEINNIEPYQEVCAVLKLFTDNELQKYQKYFNNRTYVPAKKRIGKIVNFEILTETPIKMDEVSLFTDKDMSYNKIVLKYVDIREYETLSDDSLGKYYVNEDDTDGTPDYKFYLKIKSGSNSNSGKVVIKLYTQELGERGAY